MLSQVCMAPTELRTWREDTAGDFAQPTAVLRDGIIEAAGFIGPTPYVTGRVRLSAIASDTIGPVATATWATASAGTITGHAFAPRLSIDYGSNAPYALGLASGDNVTVLIEGEINLDATGVWRFLLDANDKGFVELAPPGGDYTHLVADSNVGTMVSYTVTQVGWHRLRAAFADTSQFMQFVLTVDSPAVAGNGFRSVEVEQLRAPVDDLQGYELDGFDEGGLLSYVASTLDIQPLDRTLPVPDPYGFPLGTLGWAMRWSAQLLVETEGDYVFKLVSFHGHRMWIDGTQVDDNFKTTASTTSSTTPVHLVPGWHDFVADVTKEDDPTAGGMTVTVESGPQWAGQPVPIDHIRPVIGRGARWVEVSSATTLAIPDGGTTAPPRSVTLVLPVGFSPESIEVGYAITHPIQAQVSLVLDPPVGANITLIANTLTGTGLYNAHASVSVADFGATWAFIGSDNLVDAMVGSIEIAAVTMIGRGGTPPFPSTVRYESAVRELGNVIAFGTLSWQSRQGMTTVQLRTCDDAAACAAEPWADVTNGSVPAIVPRRFAQYAVGIATNGDVPTAFDSFDLTYSARPE